MATTAKFWDKIAKKYAKKPIKNMQAYDQTMDRTQAYLTNDHKVLEIGCGTGTTALRLAAKVQHYTASDISINMLEIGENKAKHQNLDNLSFVHGDVFAQAFDKGSFDAILAFNLLHLLEDAPAAIHRVNQILKPGGLLISKTICLGEGPGLWAPILFVMQKLGLAPYVSIVSFADLETSIKDQGFEIIETGLHPAKSQSRFIVARKT